MNGVEISVSQYVSVRSRLKKKQKTKKTFQMNIKKNHQLLICIQLTQK